MKSLLILGATSDIAQATASEYARHGYNLMLVGRNIARLHSFINELKTQHGVLVDSIECDLVKSNGDYSFYEQLTDKPTGILVSIGSLGDHQQAIQQDSELLSIIQPNYLDVVRFLSFVANDFEQRKFGFIMGIGSVAGDRGRQSNYVYGSAKAGLESFLSGLRNRLYQSNVHVMTVKPGFVATKMTAHLKLPPLITVNPSYVGKSIYKGYKVKKNNIYVGGIWYWIMFIIKLIPEFILKRLSL